MAPEDLPIFTGTTPKPSFFDSEEPLNHTGEKREGKGERGEGKRTPGPHNFHIAYFGVLRFLLSPYCAFDLQKNLVEIKFLVDKLRRFIFMSTKEAWKRD